MILAKPCHHFEPASLFLIFSPEDGDIRVNHIRVVVRFQPGNLGQGPGWDYCWGNGSYGCGFRKYLLNGGYMNGVWV